MTLMVTAGERWLADVGFGDSFIEPLLFEPGREDVQRGASYRIVSDEKRFVLEKAAPGDPWESQYRFALTPYQYSDYLPRCKYQQTSPESHFTQNRICSLLTTNGRVSVSDTRFIVSENGARRERAVNGEKDYAELLREHFGIVM
jgi:N-hydroxyarylamine O-acetyltransferase